MDLSTQIKNQENLDIFIYSHIPFKPISENHIYKVLTNSHEEAKNFNTDLAIYRDYNGYNISENNLMYNEYCGFYWIWKNYPMKKYVALNHYRRYYQCYNELPDFDEIFKKYKIILNERIQLRILSPELPRFNELLTNREWYAYWHNIKDFELLETIIKDQFPQYADGFDRMANAKYCHGCNMFTMPKDIFIEYCEFVFPVLMAFRKERGFFKISDCIKYVEERKDEYIKPKLTYYDVEKQARIVGYLAERVLGTFLHSGGENSLLKNSTEFKWFMVDEKKYRV